MCWFSDKTPLKRVARKDMKVYKVLKCGFNNSVSSIFFKKTWILGVEEKMSYDIVVQWIGDKLVRIDDGLHSLKNKPFVWNDLWFIEYDGCSYPVFKADVVYNERVFECTIPKGSIYYMNDQGEIVSDRLIINGVCDCGVCD